jgi:anti-sigma B factor antagonist
VKPIDVSWHDTDIAFVTLYGEHDLTTSEQLAKELRTLVRSGEAVIVDLSEVEFIDSSVLNTLITTDRMAHERGSTLTLLLNTAPIVRRLVEISGLTDHLSCAGSREEAIQAARRPQPPSGGSAL